MQVAHVSSNWLTTAGDLQQCPREPADAAQAQQSAAAVLKKPNDEAGPCSTIIHLQQPLAPCQQLMVCSNARIIELSVQRPGDATASYLQTLRCDKHGEYWQGTVSLQGAVGCTSLQLKLLSLQGTDRSICTVHALCLQQDKAAPVSAAEDAGNSSRQQQQPSSQLEPQAEASGGAADGTASAAPPQQQQQQQQPVSQLDELRMLIQQLQQPGPSGDSAAGLPESLQLLHSKATAAPQAGPEAAIKTLSAHIAQGMLFQAAQQRAAQADEQQAAHQQQQHAAHHQRQDAGGCEAQQPQQQIQPPQQPAGQAQDQGLVSLLQRLEAKVDQLADNVTVGLQQLSERVARLEASMAGFGSTHIRL